MLVSYQVAPIFAQFFSDETPSLLLPFLVRGAIWAVVGMTAGLALGWGWRGLPGIPGMRSAEWPAAFAAPSPSRCSMPCSFRADRNDAVIPSSTQSRLLAYVFVSVGVAIGAVLFGRQRSRPAGRTSRTNLSPSFFRSEPIADTDEVIGLDRMGGLLPGARHVALDAPFGGIDRASRSHLL